MRVPTARIVHALRRIAAPLVLALALGSCAAPPAGPSIMAPARTTGLIAVSTEGSASVRILHVRGASIVLLRTVFLPPGERVRSVAWSSDERRAVITTAGGVLALDTRSWRLAPVVRVAALATHEAGVDGRR